MVDSQDYGELGMGHAQGCADCADSAQLWVGEVEGFEEREFFIDADLLLEVWWVSLNCSDLNSSL